MIKRYSIVKREVVQIQNDPIQIQVFINPDEGEMKVLAEQYKIHEHSINSSMDPQELGRIEFTKEHIAMILKTPKSYSSEDDFIFKIKSFGLFVFKDMLIVLLAEDFPLFETNNFNKVGNLKDVILKLIFQSISHFEGHLKVINMCSDDIEKDLNTSMTNQQLLNMFKIEKSLVFYLNAINTNGRVIDKVKANIEKFGFNSAQEEFLDDLAIENTQCYKTAEIYSQVLSGLMDARASVISNNLNYMMKNLNALVISVAIPSFFAAVGGMSEFSSMIGFGNWKYGYAIFLICMILIGIITFVIIKKTENLWKKF